MKEFRKNEQGFIICEECGRLCKSLNSLTTHIYKSHNGKEDYFLKWIKDENNKCLNCNQKLEFKSFSKRDNKYCCNKCAKEYSYKHRKETFTERYSSTSSFQSIDMKKIFMDKYGVENPSQNKDFFEKALKTGRKIKKFKDTNIWYQGSYELDFLEKFYDKYPDIKRAPSIKYIIEKENKIYHPDFYIPSINLIIEIKSKYWFNKHKNLCIAKEKATIANGFKYLMIIDKNYIFD